MQTLKVDPSICAIMSFMSGLHLKGVFDEYEDYGAGDVADNIQSSICNIIHANIDHIICNNSTHQIPSLLVT